MTPLHWCYKLLQYIEKQYCVFKTLNIVFLILISFSGVALEPKICYGRCVCVKVECGLRLNLDWTSESEFYSRHRLLDTIRKDYL